MSTKIQGGSNTAGLANVDAGYNLNITLPQVTTPAGVDAPQYVGAARLFSENDPGTITGEAYLKSPETSTDYRLRVGMDNLLFEDSFNAVTQNTNNWYYQFATLTAAQPGAGTINFGTVQGTTNAHGAYMRTFQHFPLVNTAPLCVEIFGGSFIAELVAGEVWMAGLGLPTAAVTIPTDGIYWQLTSGGLEGILKFNNTEVSTGILMLQSEMTLAKISDWAIVVGEKEVEFWMADALLKTIEIPDGFATPFLGISLPIFMMKYNTGAVSNTNQIRVSRTAVSLMDLASNRPWGHALSAMGRNAYTGQNGHAQGLTAGNYAGAAAIPATQAGSNTAPNVSKLGLGGVFQMTAQVSTAGASGDMVAQYYQNPAHTINITGRNLIITAVQISCVNYGAIIATTPTTLLWGLAFGHTSVSLATPETGTFVTVTTHSPRKKPLGFMYAPVGAVIGQPYDRLLEQDFQIAPIVIRPGEFLATTVRFLVGTATASQTILYTINFNGYFE